MEVRPKKCRHGLYPETCAICKGLVTRENQTRAYGILREADFQDLENEEEREEEESVKEFSKVFADDIDDRIAAADFDEALTPSPSNNPQLQEER